MKIFFSLFLITLFSCGEKVYIDKIEISNQPLQTSIVNCPPQGTAKSTRIQELNKLKNRSIFPEEKDFDKTITLAKLLALGNDVLRWKTNQAVSIVGYVFEVKPGGSETCNCQAKDQDLKDTHIELVLDPMHLDKNKSLVAEINPAIRKLMKQKGIDWSTRAIRDKYLGRWVKIEGWLFFDDEHKNMAENTAPGREKNWRGTAWEIHPVTSIEVTTRN